MVILIGGASHTGKTCLAQKLLEKLHYPYVSIDHIKMGLIRSGQTHLTPADDEALTDYLWPIVREIIKTAIENRQNLILEGCYIPTAWQKDFSEEYLPHIRGIFLIMSESYIHRCFDAILAYASIVEARLDDSDLSLADLKADNATYLQQCQDQGCDYLLIDEDYCVTAEAVEAFF